MNYYAQDCPEALFAAKEASKDMANPREGSGAKLKRLVRFLIGREAVVWKYRWQEEGQVLWVFSDSDWGGDRSDRKSTTGGAIMFGDHCWKAWSSTQGAVALSSAEAEFYAMVEGTQRAKWAVTVATELGVRLAGNGLVLKTDSEAAKSFVCRRGLGRMRHIEVRELWLQEEVRLGKVVMIKMPGTENPADLMTKFLKKSEVVDRLWRMGKQWKDVYGMLPIEKHVFV